MNTTGDTLKIDAWLANRENQLNRAKEEGEADGAMGNPPSEGVSAHPYLRRIEDQCLTGMQNASDEVLAAPAANYEKAKRTLEEKENALKTKLKYNPKENPDDYSGEEGLGDANRLHDELSKKRQNAFKELKDLDRGMSQPSGYRFRCWYLGLLAFFALAELNVNRTAFELFFPPSTSLLISLVVGVGLLAGAHEVGLWIRQCVHESDSSRRWLYVAEIAGVLLAQCVVVLLLAACRHAYILVNRAASSGVSTEDILGAAGGDTPTAAQVAQQAFSFDFGVEGWTLLVINLFMLAIGTVASAIRHHPDREYEERWVDWNKARRKDERRRRKWEKGHTRGKEMPNLQKKVNQAQDELTSAQQSLDAKAEQVARRVVEIVEAYEYANLGDPPRPRPSCFYTASDERFKDLEQGMLERLYAIVDGRTRSSRETEQ